MQAASRSATRSRCSTSRNARTPPSDEDDAAAVNLTTTGLPEADDRPGSGSIGSFMANTARLKSRTSASTTKFYANSTV